MSFEEKFNLTAQVFFVLFVVFTVRLCRAQLYQPACSSIISFFAE